MVSFRIPPQGGLQTFGAKSLREGDLGPVSREISLKYRRPVSRKPKNLLGTLSHSKISSLKITELFYSHILNMNRGSLHTRSFRRIHFSVFRYRWTKNGFIGPKSSGAFEKRAPGPFDPFPRIAIYPCSLTSHQHSFIFLDGDTLGAEVEKKKATNIPSCTYLQSAFGKMLLFTRCFKENPSKLCFIGKLIN